MSTSRDPNTVAITMLRLAIGLFFAIFGEYKVFGTEFTLHGGFQEAVKGFISGGAYPFMVPILHGILVHFATAMAFAVAYGELLIGVWSRIASGFGSC